MTINVINIISPSYLDIQVNRTYNFLIKQGDKFVDIRGLVQIKTKNSITIKVIEE